MLTKKSVQKNSSVEMSGEEFRKLGYQLVDRIADFIDHIPENHVSLEITPQEIMAQLGERSLPETGADPATILENATDLLFKYSVHTTHPRFMGYICPPAAPIGSLADLLAATVNPNTGGWFISPMATQIETQTIQWLGELVGYGADCSGVLVSGGNMANFVPFLAARRAKVDWNINDEGLNGENSKQLRVYTSKETHTWVQKAVELFGLGNDALCWLPTDNQSRMDTDALRHQIEADVAAGMFPFMIIGTAGSTAVGAIDPLPEIAKIAREYDLWFHIDGAYGAAAGVLGADAPPEFAAFKEADSIAIDPHKWLYIPLEAGAVLVKDAQYLVDTFSHHPEYYHHDEISGKVDYHEYGMQNSRGFRALKIWMALQQAGRDGYKQMIADDIRRSKLLAEIVGAEPDFEFKTQSLSVTTFRYIPDGLQSGDPATETYLNALHDAVVNALHTHPDAFLSNAVVEGQHVLRACIINFRTTDEDIKLIPQIVREVGKQLDSEMRPDHLRSN